MKAFDMALTTLNVIAAAVSRELHILYCHVKTERNTFVPFNLLPIEIATNILLLSIAGQKWWRREVDKLSLVCHSWRNVIASTPRFWGGICATEFREIEGLHLFLKRSGSIPLHIYIPPLKEVFEPDFFWRSLFPHARRIASLSTNGYCSLETPPGMEDVLAAALPSLTSLSIGPRWPSTESHKPLCVKLKSERLQELTLVLFQLRWDAMILPRLRLLKVCNRGPRGPSVRQILRSLAGLPMLEAIHLGCWGEPLSPPDADAEAT